MQRISITNPQNIIDGTAKKYYFKLRNTGGPKGDKGDKGDTGQTGPQGPKGDAATVAIGSTTTLPVGYNATVENVGSIYNAVLNFGIPQGPQGPQGAKGDKGDTGAQGETGPRGPQGERGTNATVYVGTTTTTNPGTQARVYNSGTDSNAVLNFEIPRGDVGPMPTIAQTTGQAIDQVMSQKATTDALATKQNTIDSSHKLSADLVTDTTTTNKFVTASDKTTWNAKQNALTAGDNITISGDTISATDTTYTAGNGLNLNGTEFSADTTVLATKEDLASYYTKPETDNLLAPKLEAEVVAELPTTGEESKLYLTPKAHTTQTATGNPITVSVTEQAGALESFKLDGDTFQQTYSGKNLFNPNETPLVARVAYNTSGEIKDWSDYVGFDQYMAVSPNTGYVFSCSKVGKTIRVVFYDSNKSVLSVTSAATSFTTPADCVYIRGCIYLQGEVMPEWTQIELGSAATSYEPYTGGQASPNPDYPQAIQTVTGEQTVSINGANYLIDLGSIELCKLGTYQDYIYKDGEDWKIHKAIGRYVFTGEETSTWDSTIPRIYLSIGQLADIGIYPVIPASANILPFAVTSKFSIKTFASFYTNRESNGFAMSTQGKNFNFGDKSWTQKSDGQADINGTVVYYALETPTDTTITDTTLIAQLEAIRTAMLQNGANTITNTATGSNLAGDMEIGYYGFAPRNRYDKWLWLDINNEYEQIGS